jgi:Flagellar basal body-associated protein
MGQQRDPSPETDPDSVEEAPPSFVEQHFWSILAGVVLLALGAGGAVAYTQYEQVDRTVRSIPYSDQVADQAGQLASAVPYVGGDPSEAGKRTYGSFTRMKGLVVNPAGSGGNRYLAVSIAFESKNQAVRAEMEDKKVVVKDAILTLLSEQTAEKLSDPDRRDELKAELLKETNGILSDGTVDRLYFTEFVLQ